LIIYSDFCFYFLVLHNTFRINFLFKYQTLNFFNDVNSSKQQQTNTSIKYNINITFTHNINMQFKHLLVQEVEKRKREISSSGFLGNNLGVTYDANASTYDQNSTVFVELGAGKGLLGLAVSCIKVCCCLNKI
jgi:hypothetical protein